MQTKLTLRLDDRLIEKAKDFAGKSGKSLSQVVADYFAAILAQEESNAQPDEAEEVLTPLVQELKGSLAGNDLAEQDYYAYLEEKYLQR